MTAPYIAIGIAINWFLIILVLTYENIFSVSGGQWAWRRVATFIGIQVACFGPLLFMGGFLFLKNCLNTHKAGLLALLSFFGIPFTIFAALSGGGSLPHWTTPAWFCLAPFAGIGLTKAWSMHHQLAIRVLLIIQILLCLVGFGFVLSGV